MTPRDGKCRFAGTPLATRRSHAVRLSDALVSELVSAPTPFCTRFCTHRVDHQQPERLSPALRDT
jgi:hypothetical protein